MYKTYTWKRMNKIYFYYIIKYRKTHLDSKLINCLGETYRNVLQVF